MSNFEFQYELQDVRRSATALMKRIEHLETVAKSLLSETPDSLMADLNRSANTGESPSIAANICARSDSWLVQPEPMKIEIPPSTEKAHSSQMQNSELSASSNSDNGSKPSDGSDSTAVPSESLEVWLGKNLNKIGISFLVIGCALALIYQFQYFTPLFKILTGILAGIALILGGEWFERKPTFNWYGRALIGGGWSLAYFSAFAAHHVPSVKIIDSALLDLVLLLGIAIGAVKYSLRYKSEAVTALTLSLGFVTICMSSVTSFSVAAIAILIAGTAWLVGKMRWFNLLVYAEIVSYIFGLTIVLPQIMSEPVKFFGMSLHDSHFVTATAYAFFCWAVFNLIIFTVRYTNIKERNRVATSAFFNALFFVPTVLGLMSPDHLEFRSSFLYSVAAAYALTGFSAKQNSMYAILKLHTVMALSLATYAVSFNLHGNTLTTFWCLEVPVLVWASYYFDMVVVRRFAAVLALICAGSVLGNIRYHYDPVNFRYIKETNLVTDLTALGAACAAGAVYVYEALRTSRETNEPPKGGIVFYYYWLLAGLASLLVTSTFIAEPWIALVLTLQCISAIAIGACINYSPLRLVGTVGLICSQLWFLFSSIPWTTLPIATIVGLHYLMSYVYRTASKEQKGSLDLFEQEIHHCYAVAGSIILANLLSRVVPQEWLTVSWTLQAIALLFVGFNVKDKVYRVSGLVLLCIVIGRLLFFELSGLETIYRIISFMAAGVVLLVASFAYAKLGSKDADRQDAPKNHNERSEAATNQATQNPA